MDDTAADNTSNVDASRPNGAWTPVARAAARLDLVSDEEPGSMQHFTTALLLGDLLTRVHAAFLISALARFDEPVAKRFWFSLARASGAGEWINAMRETCDRLRDFELAEDLFGIVCWPTSTPDRDSERDRFVPIAEAIEDLAARLQHRAAESVGKRIARIWLFESLVQIRNKTVHGAYESRFYADHVQVVDAAVAWLLRETPLWACDLICVSAPRRGRVFRGLAPVRSASVGDDLLRDEVAFSLSGEAWRGGPLLQVRGHDVYVANGSWRESDATAEFLCHSLVAAGPGEGTLRLGLPDLARPPLPSVGQLVDRNYRILRVLGEGEDAVVFLAHHKDEDVECVLKSFREPKGSFDQRRVEFDALQRIRHPSVPRVQEIYSWEDPIHLRLDYVAGVPLEMKRSDFSGDVGSVCSLGIAVADALVAVHAAGYVHRDVAPDNILIPNDPQDPVRLVDFDLVAKIGTVGLAGTSIYRPPESELGLPWTEASDVYSLGVLLFELLTGRLPYATTDGGADRRHIHPSDEEKERFGALLRVLLKASAPKAQARYQNAVRLRKALARAAALSPTRG